MTNQGRRRNHRLLRDQKLTQLPYKIWAEWKKLLRQIQQGRSHSDDQ